MPGSVMTQSTADNSRPRTVDVSIRGVWHTVPALQIEGTTIAITGTWLKMAILHDENLAERQIEDPELYIRTLREQPSGLRADIFTFTQKPPASQPAFPYPMERESVAVVRTSSFKEWWEKLPQESRKNVRRAEKRGVVTVVKQLDDELVQDIVELNNDSPLRQGRRFVHYGKAFDEVKKDQSPYLDRSDYVCAYLGDELIGFIKVVYRGNVAAIVQILPKASHHDKRPANAMLARTVELCEAKCADYLTYGLFNYGNKGDSPLRVFKVRNGFEEMLMPRFYVPLTAFGTVCTKLRLYRGLVGLLPESMIKIGVSARAKWYDLRHAHEKPV
jgi:hypothetical protein